MPNKEQIQAWVTAGEAVHVARQHHEQCGGRTAGDIKRLREIAAKTAAICGDCFEPLSSTASVTTVWRFVEHIPQFKDGIGQLIPAHDRKLTVPICLHCWLIDITAQHAQSVRLFLRGFKPSHHLDRAGPAEFFHVLRRLRCEHCERPIRTDRLSRYSSRLALSDRCCCTDCLRKATLHQANERRRVRHQDIACVVCGEMFTPRQSTAKTCSNVCRQRLFRRQQRG
jgi:hypothetical protein